MIGEIYLITNKQNGKKYVGQALKKVGKLELPWGTEGRWKSHIRESCEGSQNHCVYLNSAIRKYGASAFDVQKLADCESLAQMNEFEEQFIREHNTLAPHGYNLKSGGANGKDSDETREKKRQMRLGKKHEETVKEKISKGQLGNRRQAKVRKHPEDADLPKYINAKRKTGKIIGYDISCFPVGVDSKQYISKSFTCQTNPMEAYEKAVKYLEELKKEYADMTESMPRSTPTEVVRSVEKRSRKNKQGVDKYDMPKYVSLKTANGVPIGFAVDGLRIINDDGTVRIYSKHFVNKLMTMEEKLQLAKDHLEETKKNFKCYIDEHINKEA